MNQRGDGTKICDEGRDRTERLRVSGDSHQELVAITSPFK